MKVYIAGPMTGLPDFNYPAFHALAADLRSAGYVVVNPAENFAGDQTLPYRTYLREAVRSLVDCDAVALLPGWENSRGAMLERSIAETLGMVLMDVDHESVPVVLPW
jgi:hypothetical protein